MRIMMIGSGGIGGLMGGYLIRGGASVSFLVKRNEVAETINKKGLKLMGEKETFVVMPEAVYTEIPSHYSSDLVIVAVKSEATNAVLEKIKPFQFNVITSLQNGLNKYEVLTSAFGAEKVLGMFTICFGTIIRDGSIRVSKLGKTYIGEINGKESKRAGEIANVLEMGGLQVEVTNDILSCEWSKKAHWIPISIISAVARNYFPQVYTEKELSELLLKLQLEVAYVAGRMGITISDLEDFEPQKLIKMGEKAIDYLKAKGEKLNYGPMREYRQIMLQDVEAHRRSEMEETAGYVLQKAEEYGLEIPYTETLVRIIRFWEKHL